MSYQKQTDGVVHIQLLSRVIRIILDLLVALVKESPVFRPSVEIKKAANHHRPIGCMKTEFIESPPHDWQSIANQISPPQTSFL